MRQAISWAVDRSQVMRVAAAGFGRLTAPATAPMKQWQLPEEQWMKYYKPDVEKAKKLMAEAGAGGRLHREAACVIPTFPTMVSGAPVIAAQLKRIGITAEIENVEYAVWIKRWLAKDFDMTMNTHAGLRRPRHRVLPRAALHQGPELELVERARARRPAGGGPAHDGPQEAQGDLRPGADHDPRERAAPLAVLGRHDRLHPGHASRASASTRRRCCTASRASGSTRPRQTERERVARYVVVRLYSMALTLVGLSVLVFLMLRLVPGTVVEQMIGADAIVSPAMVAELKRFFGLDQPWWRQYGTLDRRPRPGRPRHLVADGQAGGRADPRAAAGDDRADRAGGRLRAAARHPGRHPVRDAARPGRSTTSRASARCSGCRSPCSGRARC